MMDERVVFEWHAGEDGEWVWHCQDEQPRPSRRGRRPDWKASGRPPVRRWRRRTLEVLEGLYSTLYGDDV